MILRFVHKRQDHAVKSKINKNYKFSKIGRYAAVWHYAALWHYHAVKIKISENIKCQNWSLFCLRVLSCRKNKN